ncbi:hypothetical protein AB0H83_11195 [Dactylosporangium sp. NPDC050688]|uniref:hypothetical protein n=1 Tax=Dactylosporangium sp. NPDC050688 TaxID=3157217 RepID=UPI0033FE8516
MQRATARPSWQQVCRSTGGPRAPSSVERLVRPLLGDWEHIAASGAVLRQLAALCGDVAANVDAADRTLMTSWDSNAAAAADDYFTTLAARTDKLAAPIADLADLHEQAATTAFTAGKAIKAKGLITTLIDLASPPRQSRPSGPRSSKPASARSSPKCTNLRPPPLRTAYNVLLDLTSLIEAAITRRHSIPELDSPAPRTTTRPRPPRPAPTAPTRPPDPDRQERPNADPRSCRPSTAYASALTPAVDAFTDRHHTLDRTSAKNSARTTASPRPTPHRYVIARGSRRQAARRTSRMGRRCHGTEPGTARYMRISRHSSSSRVATATKSETVGQQP